MSEMFVRSLEQANSYKRHTRDTKEILKKHYLNYYTRIDKDLAE